MYHTSFIIGWMGFVTVDVCDIAVLDHPGAGARGMMLPAIVFRVSVFLTAHA
jgi:hypothetical protein